MKRRLTKLVAFLLLGAIVNVAVAWGCALTFWYAGYRGTVRHTPEVARELSLRYQPAAADLPVALFEGYDEIYFGRRLSIAVADGEVPKKLYTHVVSAGWPIYSMIGVFRIADNESDIRSLWVLPWEPRVNVIAIPLRPIWTGFAINTIFYAVIMWVLWSSPFAARRMIRRKRGRCLNCGYDLRGTSEGEVCPECGEESPKQTDSS